VGLAARKSGAIHVLISIIGIAAFLCISPNRCSLS
jgi:hypothetical protein